MRVEDNNVTCKTPRLGVHGLGYQIREQLR